MDNKTDQRYIGIPSMHKPEILRELSTVYNYILKEEVYFLKFQHIRAMLVILTI